uniref:Uncharacterized protein n=1 Tax=Cucumis melo TaxID=3656 RepID=A0A9I9EE77_CUCME
MEMRRMGLRLGFLLSLFVVREGRNFEEEKGSVREEEMRGIL